jgi:hypothetical protein
VPKLLGQIVEPAEDTDSHRLFAVQGSERLELVGYNLKKRRQLPLGTREILVRERPDGDLLDAERSTPIE